MSFKYCKFTTDVSSTVASFHLVAPLHKIQLKSQTNADYLIKNDKFSVLGSIAVAVVALLHHCTRDHLIAILPLNG